MVRRMKAKTCSLLLAAAGLCAAGTAEAHPAISNGPTAANGRAIINFGVGHGCAGKDTVKLTVEIPAGVTSVRALGSTLGAASVTLDGANNVTSVTWEKPPAEALAGDPMFYEASIRVRLPDVSFSTIFFRVTQTCNVPGGAAGGPDEEIVEWFDTPTTPINEQTGEPAAELKVVPTRFPGWNQHTMSAAMTDLEKFFADAQIVWRGTAAFSPNPAIAALIQATPGVTALTEIASGDEIWVKY
jgi:uncharacterized protein YcnI